MALVSPNTVNLAKKVADHAVTSRILSKELLEVFDIQNKHIFEVSIFPENFSSRWVNLGSTVFDNAVASLHLQSIDCNFFGIEYERYNHEQGAATLTYPEDVTMTFLENELAVVRFWIQKWMSETAAMRTFSGVPGDYVFKDNQNAAKKTAIVIPQMTTGIPSACWIKIDGMRFKSMDTWTFAQDSTEPLTITVHCAVDNIKLFSPLTPFL